MASRSWYCCAEHCAIQTVIPFLGTIVAGEIHLHEHAAAVWLAPDTLADVDWA
jgi:hypothetical protein